MKLVTYAVDGRPQAGVLLESRIHDVAKLLGEGHLRDVQAILELPYDGLTRLAEVLSTVPPGEGSGRPGESSNLFAPVLRPPNVRDHFTFEDHATAGGTVELPDVWYDEPIYYYSGTGRMMGDGDTVQMPQTQMLDYELEIAAVVGSDVSDVAPEDAWAVIAGFAIFNDWSARDIQRSEMRAGLGPSKGKDFGSSLGPWIVTLDELAPFIKDDRLDLGCRVLVNGELWGESRSGTMHHSWPAIISHAAADGRLLPGDLLASGTVSGCCVADARRRGFDARYLRPGDRVELAVDGLGTLTNDVGPLAPRR